MSFVMPSHNDSGLGHIKVLVNETFAKVMQAEIWRVHVLPHWGLPSQNSPSWNSGAILKVSPSSPAGERSCGEPLEDAISHEELTTMRITELTEAVNSKDEISHKRSILGPSSPACVVEHNLRVTPVDPYGAEKEPSQL